MAAPGDAMRPEDDPGWASYAETILHFHASPPLEIPLSSPVSVEARAGLQALGLSGPFGLLTPCNPRGRRTSKADNAERLTQFLTALDNSSMVYVRVDGLSPDRLHSEEGVALAWPQADVLKLARTCEQSAIYWWDGDAFWVIGALTVVPPWRLGGEG